MTTKKFNPPPFRHPYERARVITRVRGPSMTHQSHRDICDINHIVRRFAQTGMLPPQREPQYVDLTQFPDSLDKAIIQSREVLDTVGRDVEAHNEERVKQKQQEQIDLVSEVERLRQENAALKPKTGKASEVPSEA